MKLRTALLISLFLMIAAILAATVGSVVAVLRRDARVRLSEELVRGATVFEELQAYRQDLFESQARMLAEEPRLKAVIASEGVSRDTIVEVTIEVSKLVTNDLFLLLTPEGSLVADVRKPTESGGSLANRPLVAEAMKSGRSSGITIDDGHVFQVQSQAMAFGALTVGIVLVGHELDDRVAQTLFRQTGSTAAVLLDGKPVALSDFEDKAAKLDRNAVASALANLTSAKQPVLVELAGSDYIAVRAKLPGYAGDQKLDYVMMRSLDIALAPVKRLTNILYAIAGLALLAASLIAVLLSRRLARPLDVLVTVARRIGSGDLNTQAKVGGAVEVRVLGDAMNLMVRELRSSRQKLEKQYEELRELDLLKDQFLANTSHELRTPINGILGLISAVLDGVDGPINLKQREHLRMVKESADRLKNLISNILDFAKLRAGHQAFELGYLKLSDLSSHLRGLGEGLLHGKPVELAIDIPDDLPPVWADHERVLQVLVNLLGNAAKFTSQGSITISAMAKGDEIVIGVEDTGPGIPDEARRYLFQEFRQVDGSASRQFEGTGLGLAISKKLVTAMGGKINYESEVGKGTHFFFSLQSRPEAVPAVRVEDSIKPLLSEKETTDVRVERKELRGGGELILIVDDNRENLEALKLLLEESGYKTVTALSAVQALEIIDEQSVNLVLSDVRMPGRSGLELCRDIKLKTKLPVFLITAQASTPGDLHAAAESGSDAYFLKPFEPVALLRRIHGQLQPRANAPQGRGESIVVVNDNPVTGEQTARQLRGAGYKVHVENNPAKAADTTFAVKADLVLVELKLASLSGFDVGQRIRGDARVALVPIILISGFVGPSEQSRAREIGAQELMARPYEEFDLLANVDQQLKQRTARATRQGRGEKILVVDDVAINVEALATLLEHAGYTPLRASSGAEAIKIARAEHPNAIISDVMMPGITGYDLCRMVAADPSLGKPPIILLTAKTGNLQDTLLGLDQGAVDYMIKPFEPDELVARLARALRRAPAVAPPTADTMIGDAVVSVTSEQLSAPLPGGGEVILCVDDNPINLEVLKTHLEGANYRAVVAKDGIEALEVLDRVSPHLILLDIMMPRMDGFEFLRQLRTRPMHASTPVIVLSAKDKADDSLTGFKLGVVDFVTKPFNGAIVVSKVTAIIALRNAQLALGELNAELNVARLVQNASFPHPELSIPGAELAGFIQSASTSGGDWYGYYTSPDQDRLTIVTGDVTGHGVSATVIALAAFTIKSTIELLETMVHSSTMAETVLAALEGKIPDHVHRGFKKFLSIPNSPSALASLFNDVLCRSRSLGMTACVMNFETSTGTLRYAVAGCPQPIMLRGDQLSRLPVVPSDMLGRNKEAEYVEGTIVLEHGDTVIVYSDGVSEARSPDGTQYGNRLTRLLRSSNHKKDTTPQQVRELIITDLFQYTADHPLDDDVTLVALKRPLAGR